VTLEAGANVSAGPNRAVEARDKETKERGGQLEWRVVEGTSFSEKELFSGGRFLEWRRTRERKSLSTKNRGGSLAL